MTNFVLIFICISTGVILSRLKILSHDAYKSVNAWLINVALPALALRYVPEIKWSLNILLPVLSPIVVWCGAWLFVRIYNRNNRLTPGSHAALLIACGLGNTAFIGFPMIAAFYGEQEIRHAVVFDQVTFILFSTVGVITILRASAGKVKEINFLSVAKKIFRFPPFIACLLALILPCFISISIAVPLLDKLVATMSPLALFSVGLQLRLGEIRKEWRLLSVGLLYKLILAPCFILILAFFMQSSGNLPRISVFEAGMSTHITASLLAGQYKLNPQFSSLMVGVGIVAGFVTSSIWYLAMQYLF
jgi:predicted permease